MLAPWTIRACRARHRAAGPTAIACRCVFLRRAHVLPSTGVAAMGAADPEYRAVRTRSIHPAAPPADPHVPVWLVPFLLYVPGAAWVGVSARLLSSAPGRELAAQCSPSLITWFVLLVVAVGVLVETSCFVVLWAARGHRLPFARMAIVYAQLTVLEPIADALMQRLPPGSTGAAYLAPWVGARALWEQGAPGAWSAAFGTLGVFALLRMSLAAAAQAHLVRRPWREAFAQVFAVWCVSHVALALMLSLLQGAALPQGSY